MHLNSLFSVVSTFPLNLRFPACHASGKSIHVLAKGCRQNSSLFVDQATSRSSEPQRNLKKPRLLNLLLTFSCCSVVCLLESAFLSLSGSSWKAWWEVSKAKLSAQLEMCLMLLQKSTVLKQSEFCADYINLTSLLTTNILKGTIALLLDMLLYILDGYAMVFITVTKWTCFCYAYLFTFDMVIIWYSFEYGNSITVNLSLITKYFIQMTICFLYMIMAIAQYGTYHSQYVVWWTWVN